MNVGLMRFVRELPSFSKKGSYLFVGDDDYFKNKGVQLLKQQLRKLKPDEEEFDGTKAKTSLVFESLCEYPMLGPFRLVTVTHADKLTGWEKLKPLFTDPSEAVRAIFTSSDDPEGDFEDFPCETKVVCKDMRPGSKEFDRYLDFCVEGYGKTLDEAARNYLGEVFVNNAYLLEGELKKVAFFVGEKTSITKDDLKQTLSYFPVGEVFDLVDAVIRRDLTVALRLTNDLFSKGTETGLLTHLITMRIRQIHEAMRAQATGEKLKDFMIRRKIPLFQVEQLITGLKFLKEFHIRRWYDVLCAAEARAKRGDGQLVFEGLVVQLCH